jgi:hypothetical protein
MNVLLPRISILVASTKSIDSRDCFFFQDCMHDLLDLIQEFSLVLLCLAGSEACPGELKDARFWPVQAKTSGIYERNIPLSRRTSHSAPTSSTQRMPFTKEKRCDYDLRHDSYAIHKTKMNKRTCRVLLQAPLHDFSPRQDPLVSPKTTAVTEKSKSAQRFIILYPD